MLNSSTLHSFENIVGEANVLADPYDLDRYSTDALTPFRAFGVEEALQRLADLVVRPATTEQVSEIVALASQQRIPLIPYGGGTGVMGGTLPVQGGIVIELQRMNRILEVSPQDQTVTVEAGTPGPQSPTPARQSWPLRARSRIMIASRRDEHCAWQTESALAGPVNKEPENWDFDQIRRRQNNEAAAC